MSAKTILNRVNLPSVRVNTTTAASTGSLVVNNRNLGRRGELSQDFGSHSVTTREKLQLRHLMAQSQSQNLDNNPIQKRRLQQKIAVKAGELYNLDPRQLMSAGSQTVDGVARHNNRQNATYGRSNAADNYGLRDKINATKPPMRINH